MAQMTQMAQAAKIFVFIRAVCHSCHLFPAIIASFLCFESVIIKRVMSDLIKTLASYVPNLILHRIVRYPEPISEPTFESLPAATFYADITGFSELTERLEGVASAGQAAGAEAVTNAVNAYFDQFIEILHAHGGDIVKFTGDGVLALWAVDTAQPVARIGSALRDAVHRAAQCGLEVQRALKGYQTSGGISLSIRIGIGAGDVVVAHLGGVFNRWEVLIAGDPVVQSHAAENRANPGEVILSPHAYRLIRAYADGAPLTLKPDPDEDIPDMLGGEGVGLLLRNLLERLPPRPLPEISLPPGMEPALRPYIPAAILTRLDAGQSAWLSELRRVTVLFINLPDFNTISSDTLEQAQKALRELQRMIYKQQGSLNKLNVDEKGATLVAALGLPPLSHVDDPERGARAAMEAEQALRALGMRTYVGVATGLTFSGVIGSSRRREYTMMGDPVNLAARLMQAAKRPDIGLNPEGGAVLVDLNTYAGANASIVFETLLPIKVKGRRQPVTAFQPIRPHLSPILDRHDEWARALVGRAEERFTIAEQLQELQRGGTGGVFIIEGEAGIGKSRLAKEIIDQAQALGINTYLGVGDVVEQENLYHAWQPIFRKMLEIDEFSSYSDRPLNKIVRLMTDPEILRLYPLLADVLDINLEDNEFTAQMEGQVRANNTRYLLLRLFEAACKETPTVLVLEDTQWMDTASWAVLYDIWAKVHPLLLVITTRPWDDAPRQEYLEIRNAPSSQVMRLNTLSPNEVVDLVCRCLAVSKIPEPVAHLIQEKAEGHPFFSQELAYALRDTQVLRFNNGDCFLAPNVNLETISFPNTVQGVIISRIDSLPPAEQLILKVASVIGRSFPYEPLHDLYPVVEDKPHLKLHLNTLGELDITDLETPDPNLSYIFKHNITQEVSYSLLPFSLRQQLHRQLALWHEEKYKDDLTPYYALLAHHWSNAGNAQKAVEYYEKSGEKALRGGAYQEAIRAFKQALEWDLKVQHPADEEKLHITRRKTIASQAFHRARWERQIAQAYVGLGQIPASYNHLKQALILLGRPETTRTLPLLLLLIWQILKQIYFRLFPGVTVNYPENLRLTVLEAARAYSMLSESYFYTRQNLPLVHAAVRTLNLTERAGPSPELAIAYANMGMLMGVIPIHRFARFYLQRAQQIAQSLGRLAPLGYVNLITALYSLGTGAWERVLTSIDEALRIFRELGDQRRYGEALSLKAIRCHFLAQYDESNQLYHDLHQLGENTGDIQQITWGLDGQAANFIRTGNLQQAAASLEKTQSLFEHSKDLAEETVYYGTLALLKLYQGDRESAQGAAETALERGSGTSPVYTTLEGQARAAEALLTLWDTLPPTEDSAALAAASFRAVKTLQSHANRFPFGLPRALVWQGLYEWLNGNYERAIRTWRKALEAARRLNLRYDEALAHSQLARHLPPQDPNQQEHRQQAKEIFSDLGVRHPGMYP